MSQVAYMVVGSSGYCDTYERWTVRVFLNKEKADALVERLESWMRERGYYFGGNGPPVVPYTPGERPLEDPEMIVNGDGIAYFVEEAPFEE